ncbi:MAG TPA: hypothetical protein VJ805_06520 [Nitrospiraceae bacterium]|nr:hypothetical protein [Nitrospiraceae bacterium]
MGDECLRTVPDLPQSLFLFRLSLITQVDNILIEEREFRDEIGTFPVNVGSYMLEEQTVLLLMQLFAN